MALIQVAKEQNKYNFIKGELNELTRVIREYNENKEHQEKNEEKELIMNKNIKDLNRMIARYNQLGEERKKLADIFMETVKTVTEQVIEISANKEEYNDFKSTLERIKENHPKQNNFKIKI